MPRLAALLCLLAVMPAAHAQGGPPMQNDDPETVPDGHWEINLATTGARSDAEREIEWLRADINYGLGERTQLKFEVPVTSHTERGDTTHAGVGAATVGVRFRFLDEERAGVAVSAYPQYTFDLLASSSRHGITGDDGEFLLPLEIAHDFKVFKLGAEVGHAFVESGPDEFVAGVVGGIDCPHDIECLAEVRTHSVAGHELVVANLGARIKLSESKNLLVSAGHGIGADSPERPDWVFYLGVQLLK